MAWQIENRMGTKTGSTATAHDHKEGPIPLAIEQQTAILPAEVFLWTAFASIGGSLLLHVLNCKEDAHFVGHWALTFLILGLYNKIVKVAGSDKLHSEERPLPLANIVRP